MEQTKDFIQMLNLIEHPAFSVSDGVITQVNAAARKYLITPGRKIAELLTTGADEYSTFSGGCLYLGIQIEDSAYGACVTRIETTDIFWLTQQEKDPALQAMALVAQQLRGSLATIITAADRLIPSPAVQGNPETRQQAAQISRGLHQLLRNISNMADADRYQSQTVFPMQMMDVEALFRELIEKSQTLLSQSRIQLTYRGIPQPIHCLVHEELLERAVYNLLSNAVKFAPAGGTIRASLVRRGKKLYFSLEDSGSGLKTTGNAFLHYLRQPGVEDGRNGLGLGMVIIRSAALAHGGTVLLEQPEGSGLKITMSMAIRQDGSNVRSSTLKVDYAGERDHGLIELADVLPSDSYQ